MKSRLKESADNVLRKAVAGNGVPGVPGVVAIATDRSENIYEGAAGKRDLAHDQPMTLDTVVCMFSCTKAITGAAVMQLVEEGKIGLDDPVKKYVPDIAEIGVLDGFDANGKPKVRPPKSDVTVRQLLLHADMPSITTGSLASLRSVLLFDPGVRWGVRDQHRLGRPRGRSRAGSTPGRGDARAHLRSA